MFAFLFVVTLAVLYIVATQVLSGPDLSQYDRPVGQHFEKHADDDEHTAAMLKEIKAVRTKAKDSRSIKKVLNIVREFADNLSSDWETDAEFKTVDVKGVPCEWTIHKDADTKRRVLLLHGGAFLFGSPRGHRILSDQLAKITGGVVLSVDYRLLPEQKRGASIDDAQTAYQWVLENGPNGEEAIDSLIVTGDSAGGNLALMLSSWSRDAKLRRPDAVVAFSPSTDMTLVSPTILGNRHTDKILGEGLGLLARIPLPIRALASAAAMRINPSNPLASPLFMDLSDLPPTLIQASSNEMLLGESIRYTNKAMISGSEVTLQIWQDQIHDWQLFTPESGSAKEAYAQVEQYLATLGLSRETPNALAKSA